MQHDAEVAQYYALSPAAYSELEVFEPRQAIPTADPPSPASSASAADDTSAADNTPGGETKNVVN
ncbi:MAG: hypothetical protein OJF49_002565 [Ktedonobacterales bacterium]|jgi:hypothetical protein|nr:MAG: hypothetical protein OJF49_002565 [Ktedonobacterales bacterium]